ncbi:MAG: hypothetical protein AB1813_18485, partial [Verrucomicrobiota bacterium]
MSAATGYALTFYLTACFFLLRSEVRCLAQPDNDLFLNRELIVGTNIVERGYNVDATLELGEPQHSVDSTPGQASIWWTWTAPERGFVDLEILRSSVPTTFLAIYSGTNLRSLTRLEVATFRFTEAVPVNAGFSYQIAAGCRSTNRGPISFQLRFRPRPENDFFADRISVSGPEFTLIGDCLRATAEPGEIARNTVWWTWKSPGYGFLIYSNEFGMPPWISLYQGETISTLRQIAVVPVHGYPVESGQQYHIQISETTLFPFALSMSLHDRPPNDQFDRSTLIESLIIDSPVNLRFATREPGEPNHVPNDSINRTAWWRWVAPKDALVTISTTEFQGIAAIYQGNALTNLQLVGKQSFRARRGTEYHIALVARQFGKYDGIFHFRALDQKLQVEIMEPISLGAV